MSAYAPTTFVVRAILNSPHPELRNQIALKGLLWSLFGSRGGFKWMYDYWTSAFKEMVLVVSAGTVKL